MKSRITVSQVLLLVSVLMVLALPLASAMEYRGVKMSDEEALSGKKLLLNGMGLRDTSIMGVSIRVYVGGLYVEKKTDKEGEILGSSTPKIVKTYFLRKVGSHDLKKNWKKGIDENCGDKCENIKGQVEVFVNLMPDVKGDDVMTYTLSNKNVEIALNDKKLGEVQSADLPKILLSNWIGPKPVSEELKAGMLGKAK